MATSTNRIESSFFYHRLNANKHGRHTQRFKYVFCCSKINSKIKIVSRFGCLACYFVDGKSNSQERKHSRMNSKMKAGGSVQITLLNPSKRGLNGVLRCAIPFYSPASHVLLRTSVHQLDCCLTPSLNCKFQPKKGYKHTASTSMLEAEAALVGKQI